MPDIENSRKGCRVGHGKTAEKQPVKTAETPEKQPKAVKTAVFRVFRLFCQLFFGCFAVTHSAPFSAVFRLFSVSGIWHLCRWPRRLQGSSCKRAPGACYSDRHSQTANSCNHHSCLSSLGAPTSGIVIRQRILTTDETQTTVWQGLSAMGTTYCPFSLEKISPFASDFDRRAIANLGASNNFDFGGVVRIAAATARVCTILVHSAPAHATAARREHQIQ